MARTRTLYNEYRPQEFADVVGQSVPVKTMIHALQTGNVASAYLLSGPRGVGKTTTARIFAKALLCTGERGKSQDGCGQCDSCKVFDEELSPDFMEVDAATNRGIDNIRALKEQIYMAPVSSSRKVVLIDEVHHLTSDAATGLLKILEEPPAGVVFMLATTDPQKIPATIRSRCQWMRFRPLDSRQIEDRLSYVLGREGRDAEEGVIRLVAKRADGGMRDALSMMDMLLTYSGRERVTLEDAETCFGTVSSELVEELCGYILADDIANCVGFTVRHRDADVPATELLCALLDMFSLAVIIDKCGADSAVALEGASPQAVKVAKLLDDKLGVERLLLASDIIERSLWKFDSSALDDAHVFNEIILGVADPTLDPKHLRLDDTSRQLIKETSTRSEKISKAVNVLVELQKKVIGKK